MAEVLYGKAWEGRAGSAGEEDVMKGLAFVLIVAGCMLIGDSLGSIVLAGGLILAGAVLTKVST